MSKQILVISTSPRKGGNSDTLADAFVQGAREAGHRVEKVSLCDKTIGFCKGCLTCVKTQRCVIRDDADTIARQMLTADVLVFATPIYYYGMCGQMKTLLDRANPLYSAEYRFRDVYLLAAAAEEDEHTVDGAVTAMEGIWAEFYSFYGLERGHHPRALGGFTTTSSLAFYNFQLLDHLDMITQPVLCMAGEQAETRPISEGAYEAVTGPKELCIVPEANHVDLYDDVDKIPFDRLENFFRESME